MINAFRTPGLEVLDPSGTRVSAGTTAQRATSPKAGNFRANTDLDGIEVFINGRWLTYGPALVLDTVKTANFTAIEGKVYPVKTTTGAITVSLPTNPKVGDKIAIFDYDGSWDKNYVTVQCTTRNIRALNSALVLDEEFGSCEFTYIDTTVGWAVSNSGSSFGDKVAEITTSNQVLEPWFRYLTTVNTANPVVKLPPNPLPGHRVVLVDVNKEWDVKTLRIDPNGKKFEGSTAVYDVREKNLHLELYYLNETHGWDVVRTASPDAMPMASTISGNVTVIANYRYPVNTTSLVANVSLPPNPIVGDRIAFYDLKNTFGQRVLNIIGNTKTIDGQAIKTVNRARGAIELVYIDTDQWQVVSETKTLSHDPTTKTASFNAEAGYSYKVTPAAATIVSLPAGAQAGDTVRLNFAMFNTTVSVNAFSATVGGHGTMTFGDAYSLFEFTFDGINNWTPVKLKSAFSSVSAGASASNPMVQTGRRYSVSTNAAGQGLSLPFEVNPGDWLEFDATVPGFQFPCKLVPTGAPTISSTIIGLTNNYIFDSSLIYRLEFNGAAWVTTTTSAIQRPAIQMGASGTLRPGTDVDITTRSAAVNLSLPVMAGFAPGTKITIYDASGQAATHNIVVTATGSSTFGNGSSTLEIKARYGFVELTWVSVTNRWVVTGGQAATGLAIVTKTADGTAATPATEYLLHNARAVPTMLLPASPAPGDEIVFVEGSRATPADRFYIGRNGKNINGKAVDFYTTAVGARLHFIYYNDTYGWDVVITHNPSRCVPAAKITSSNTLVEGYRSPVATSGNTPIDLTLPASPDDGDVIELYDVGGNLGVAPVNILPNGKKINGVAATYQMTRNRMAVSLTWSAADGTWNLVTDLTDMDYVTSVQSTAFTARVNSGYLVNATAPLTVTLPTSANFGDTVELYDSASTWQVGGLSLSGTINGESGLTRLSGAEGNCKLLWVGGTKGWYNTSQTSSLDALTYIVTATSQELRANYHALINFNAALSQVSLPSNAMRGDKVVLSFLPSKPPYSSLKVTSPSGETIRAGEAVGTGIAIADLSASYTFEYGELQWHMTKANNPVASGGFVRLAASAAAHYTLPGGALVTYDASVGTSATRLINLPTFDAGMNETLVSRVQILPGASGVLNHINIQPPAGYSVNHGAAGAATVISTAPAMWEFTYNPTSKDWRVVPMSSDPVPIVAGGSAYIAMPGNRMIITSGGAYSTQANLTENAVIHFSDALKVLGSGTTATFTPGAPSKVEGATSYTFRERGGDWSFARVNGDWKLISTSNPDKKMRAINANTAGANALSFEQNMDAFSIYLNTNYSLTSVNAGDNGSYQGRILFTQDGTGYRTVSVPAGWKELASSIGLALTPNSKTMMEFYRFDNEWFYELKGDKGADTEWIPPAGYGSWPGSYILSSQTNDPDTAWARLRIEFKIDGSYEITRSRHNLANNVVASGVYNRPRPDASRLPTDYEIRIMLESSSGAALTETSNALGTTWVSLGATSRYYDLYVAVGPRTAGVMQAIRRLRVETRVKTRPRTTVYSTLVNFDVKAEALAPVPPANYNQWNGLNWENMVTGKDPDTLYSMAGFEIDGPIGAGLIRVSKATNSNGNVYTSAGTYLMPGRTASMYQAIAVLRGSQSGGPNVNQLSSWVTLGGGQRVIYVEAAIGPATQGSVHNYAFFDITIREIAKPTNTFTGTLRLSAGVTTTAFTEAADFNSWRNQTISINSTLEDPAIAKCEAGLVFNTNGSFVLYTKKQDNANINVRTGTYVGPGRVATQYQAIATQTADYGSGSLTNHLSSWASLGSSVRSVICSSIVGPRYTGLQTRNGTFSVTVRESARTGYSYSGTVTINTQAQCTAPSIPPNYNVWIGATVASAQSGRDPAQISTGTAIEFYTDGTVKTWANSTVTTSGTYIMTGRPQSAYQVLAYNPTGSLEGITSNMTGSAVPINGTRYYRTNMVRGPKQTGTWAKTGTVTITVSNTLDGTSTGGTLNMKNTLTLDAPIAPGNFLSFNGQAYSAAAYSTDPAAATADILILFYVDGNWQITRLINGAETILASGSFAMPGRVGSDYDIVISSSGTGTVFNDATAWRHVNTTMGARARATYGPVATGTASASITFGVTIRERANTSNTYTASFSAGCSATCYPPTPTADYNTWNGQLARGIHNTTFGNVSIAYAQLEFATNGVFRLRSKIGTGAWAVVKTGVFTLPGRTASMYDGLAVMTAHGGNSSAPWADRVNTLAVRKALGATNEYIENMATIHNGIGPQTVGNNTHYRVTIFERADAAKDFVGTVQLYAEATTAARTYPAGDMGFNGKRYVQSLSGSAMPTDTTESEVKMWFNTNGTWSATKTGRLGGTGVTPTTIESGTFNAVGLTGTNYQILFQQSGQTGSTTQVSNPASTWTDISSSIILSVWVEAAANAVVSLNGERSFWVNIREKAIPASMRQGTVTLQAILNTAPSTPVVPSSLQLPTTLFDNALAVGAYNGITAVAALEFRTDGNCYTVTGGYGTANTINRGRWLPLGFSVSEFQVRFTAVNITGAVAPSAFSEWHGLPKADGTMGWQTLSSNRSADYSANAQSNGNHAFARVTGNLKVELRQLSTGTVLYTNTIGVSLRADVEL